MIPGERGKNKNTVSLYPYQSVSDSWCHFLHRFLIIINAVVLILDILSTATTGDYNSCALRKIKILNFKIIIIFKKSIELNDQVLIP